MEERSTEREKESMIIDFCVLSFTFWPTTHETIRFDEGSRHYVTRNALSLISQPIEKAPPLINSSS